MNINDAKLKQVLLDENYVSEKDIKKAESYVKSNNSSIYEYLINEEILSKDLIGEALAESFDVKYADLNSNLPSRGQVLKIPEELAKKMRIILFNENENSVVFATDNPEQESLKQNLQKIFPNKNIEFSFSLPDDIDFVLKYYQKSLEKRLFNLIQDKKNDAAPEIIDEIFSDAFSSQASDIHLEPQSKEIIIRFRIDGVLQEVGRLPRNVYENILNKIKVQSRLRIDEHSSTQDGSIRYEKGDRTIDLRTSIVPTVEGEKVVLRILTSYVKGISLGEIGLSQFNQAILRRAANKPFGMILTTGPTGSGKTTTLYSLIRVINHSDINITTIEDPVEYKVYGVNQIQVNPISNLTFAQGLKSIVRQDPDIILVGEIRDKETAEISVNAALTGHLLLSTFHANDAATAVPRLLDMGIEPFLLSSTLELIIAQRLVRRICEHCRFSYQINTKEIGMPHAERSFGKSKFTLYKGQGCDICNHTGYKGRTAIFELIEITPEIKNLILSKPSSQQIWTLAKKNGSKSLFEDGIEKVKNGITTIDELLRVVEADN